MARGKKGEIKITEIKSKIKEVKEIKKESELEQEVEAAEKEIVEEISSDSFVPAILSSGEDLQQQPAERHVAELRREEPEFSQSRIYSAAQQNILTEDERRARYVTPEQAMRRINPSIAQTSINFNPQSRHEDFASAELQRMRGETQERHYAEALDVSQPEKPRRRYPWET